MATPKKTGMFDKMLEKYKSQYMLKKIDGLSLTMDGNIALNSGEDEYVAIVDNHLETYPAEAIITGIPFYSIQRPINQIKVGDYVFLNNTAEGRKLAQVYDIATTKNGSTIIKVTRFSGSQETAVSTVDKLTGINTIEVVISMMDFMSGENPFANMMNMSSNNPMSNMMGIVAMMQMFGGEGSGKMDMDKLLTMMMISGGQNPFQGMIGGGQNPMAMVAMMQMFGGEGSGKMDMDKLLTMMMISGGQNPFQCMFGNMNTPANPQRTRKRGPKPVADNKPTVEEVPTEEVPTEEVPTEKVDTDE